MDTNYNNYHLNAVYLENIENYVLINEEMYKTIGRLLRIQSELLLVERRREECAARGPLVGRGDVGLDGARLETRKAVVSGRLSRERAPRK